MGSIRWDLTKSEGKFKELANVLEGVNPRRIFILCHNNPDPDTIASSWGLSFLLKKRFGIRSSLGHGGMVTRAENKAMINRLRINIKQWSRVDVSHYDGVALVDAQPGTGNNLFDRRGEPPLIVIDHHPLRKASNKAPYHDVRPTYGATSTIITELIVAAGLTPTRTLANALLYGIKTDTNFLMRGAKEADFSAFNYLSPMTNPRVLGWIEHPCLAPEYFEDYHRGLSRANLYRDVAIAYLGRLASEAIIPELADLLLRIKGVRWSLCMGQIKGLMIMSLRSTSRTYRAGRVMRRLVAGSGSAGGHREMAGGQIPLNSMSKAEIQGLPKKLIDNFLALIGRPAVLPRPLVPRDEAHA